MGQVTLLFGMSRNFWLDARHYGFYVFECLHFVFFLKDLEVCFGRQLSYLRICLIFLRFVSGFVGTDL